MPQTYDLRDRRLSLRGKLELARSRPPPAPQPVKSPPGILSRIGDKLDYFGRRVRSDITGIEDATGHDVLKKLFDIDNKEGEFDFSDVLAFGAEVGLDPLMLISGVGSLTKAGKLAQSLGKVAKEEKAITGLLKVARNVGDKKRIKSLTDKLEVVTHRRVDLATKLREMGASEKLAKTSSARARLPVAQQALVSVGLPFTSGMAAVRGAPILGAIGKAGTAIAGTRAGQFGSALFDPRTFRGDEGQLLRKSEDLEPFIKTMKQEKIGAQQVARTTDPERFAAKLEAAGVDVNDPQALADFSRLREEIGTKSDFDLVSFQRNAPDRKLAEEFRNLTDEQLLLEIVAGARASDSRLHGAVVAYAERILSPKAQAWLKKNRKGREFSNRLAHRMSTKTGDQIARKVNLVDEFTEEINRFFRGEKDIDFDWFETNPAISLSQRTLQGETAIINSELIQAVAKEFGREGIGGVPLAKFLHRGPIHGLATERGTFGLGKLEADTQKALVKLGLGDVEIPHEIAQEMYQVFQKMNAPEEISAFFKGWNKVTGLIKASITLPFPAFHIRNLFSDSILSWISGKWNAKNSLFGLNVARGKHPEFLALMERHSVISGTHAQQILSGTRGGGAGDIGGAASVLTGGTAARRGEQFLGKAREGFKKGFGKYAAFSETASRAQHFKTAMQAGMTPAEAAADVAKVLFDYGDITKFEGGLSSIILFYTWSRKVLPSIFRNYLENPRRMAMLTRATTQPTLEREEIALPNFIRESSAIPVPGLSKTGGRAFLTGVGSPLEELQKFDPTSPIQGGAGALNQIFRKIGTQLNPILKAPIEIAFGKDLFLDEDIVDLNKVPTAGRVLPLVRQFVGAKEQTLPGGGTREVGDPFRLHILRQAPWSRALKTVGQILDAGSEAFGGDLDPRKSWKEQLAIMLTGIRLSHLDEVDLARAEENQLRAKALGMIREGKVGRFDTFFATDKDRRKFKTALTELEKRVKASIPDSEGEAFLKQLRASATRRKLLFSEASAQKQTR